MKFTTRGLDEATTQAMNALILYALKHLNDLLKLTDMEPGSMERITGQKGCRLVKLSIDLSVTWSFGSKETPVKIISRTPLGEYSR